MLLVFSSSLHMDAPIYALALFWSSQSSVWYSKMVADCYWTISWCPMLLACRKDDLPMHVVTGTKVGVLGGGQLGKMLCQAASCMSIKVLTLDPLENCPASGISYCHVVGDFNDGEAVRDFAKR